MPPQEIDLRPVTHITTDAIGQPGKRVFYIQAWQDERTITLIIEKLQIQSLAVGLEQFLVELGRQFPNLAESSASYDEDKMHIHPPVDPLFRTGELGLGYDAEADEFGDMVKKGIIDPTKVVRSALQNAASVAAMVLITEALVSDIPEKEKTPAMPPGGGMGGMEGMM